MSEKSELQYWRMAERWRGQYQDLTYARVLYGDHFDPFIINSIVEFEKDVSAICFDGASGSVLDAGCGNGSILIHALAASPLQFKKLEYVGLDFSRDALMRAADRTKGSGKYCWVLGTADKLPFEDETYNRVISIGLRPVSAIQQRSLLTEFRRVLKTGGVLVKDFFNPLPHIALITKSLGRSTIPNYWMSRSSYKRQLGDAGFKIIGIRGFDYKPMPGIHLNSTILGSRTLRNIIDPYFIQERFSTFIEKRVNPSHPGTTFLGSRIFVTCRKS